MSWGEGSRHAGASMLQCGSEQSAEHRVGVRGLEEERASQGILDQTH